MKTCPYFEKKNNSLIKIKKQDIANLIAELNIKAEYLKLYLNKDKPKQELSDIMIEKLTK